MCGSPAVVNCRFTHVYPDGPAPYFTVVAPARRGEEVEQWWAIKRAVSDAVIAAGGTITHHHAVGREHRPWYDRQRPEPFAAALRGVNLADVPRCLRRLQHAESTLGKLRLFPRTEIVISECLPPEQIVDPCESSHSGRHSRNSGPGVIPEHWAMRG